MYPPTFPYRSAATYPPFEIVLGFGVFDHASHTRARGIIRSYSSNRVVLRQVPTTRKTLKAIESFTFPNSPCSLFEEFCHQDIVPAVRTTAALYPVSLRLG
eukprot:Lithocolla_globosa_v1_NODE_1753_length_2361_cov_15.383781.p3 type:complete len:101 gc:universal NODE_1753_length_2361_cov_15.383781:1468-1166(-)